MLVEPEEFARRAGLDFSNPSLLWRALTHRSYVNEHPEAIEDNERLEYLGDAALDFISASWLYHHFPEMNEGQLTRLRSGLVRTEQLAVFAEKIDLGSAMLLGRGEEASGGRSRPALLCATFEAVIGALYLEGGLERVETFIMPFLVEAVERIFDEERMVDARSRLQLWSQAHHGLTPRYKMIAAFGPDHDREFVVEVKVGPELVGRGQGKSKQEAAQMAATEALKHIGNDHDILSSG